MSSERLGPNQSESKNNSLPRQELEAFIAGEQQDSTKRFAIEDVRKLAILNHELRSIKIHDPESVLVGIINMQAKQIKRRLEPSEKSRKEKLIKEADNFKENVFHLYTQEALTALTADPAYRDKDPEELISFADFKAGNEVGRDLREIDKKINAANAQRQIEIYSKPPKKA